VPRLVREVGSAYGRRSRAAARARSAAQDGAELATETTDTGAQA
jgi:hypothetical protein